MVRPYINVEKDSLVTLRDVLTLFLGSAETKAIRKINRNLSLYSDCVYELEQIKKELEMR